MFSYPRLVVLVGWGVGMSLMGMKPHSLEATEAAPVQLARPPYNCFTREVWSPAKQAWCDQLGPDSMQDEGPELTRPGNTASEGDRNRYTTIALDTLPSNKPLHGADPKAIALSLVDLPEAEGNSQKRTSVSIQRGQSAAVMLSQVGLGDDAMQGIRYRFEFEPMRSTADEEQWQLVWVGRQQLCWPGRGPEEWTHESCI